MLVDGLHCRKILPLERQQLRFVDPRNESAPWSMEAERVLELGERPLHLASPAPKSDGPTLHEVNVRGSRALAKAV